MKRLAALLILCTSVAPPAMAQRSVAAMCYESCRDQHPDQEGAGYKQCVSTYCEDLVDAVEDEAPSVQGLVFAPPVSIAQTGRWSVVGFEERTAIVESAQGGTRLGFSCDGRGGLFLELGGVSRKDRVIGVIFDDGSPHYPYMKQTPTGFEYRLFNRHPLLVAIRNGTAVRLVEEDGSIIGDFSLRNSRNAIRTARRNCR